MTRSFPVLDCLVGISVAGRPVQQLSGDFKERAICLSASVALSMRGSATSSVQVHVCHCAAALEAGRTDATCHGASLAPEPEGHMVGDPARARSVHCRLHRLFMTSGLSKDLLVLDHMLGQI